MAIRRRNRKSHTAPVSTTMKTEKKIGLKVKENKPRKSKRRELWSNYIFRVLKQVHYDGKLSISAKAMTSLNNFIDDMYERITSEASRLILRSKRKTLGIHDLRAACLLVLPGEIGKHAISEGGKSTFCCFAKKH